MAMEDVSLYAALQRTVQAGNKNKYRMEPVNGS